MTEPTTLLTLSDVADRLRVSVRTVQRLVDRGYLRPTKIGRTAPHPLPRPPPHRRLDDAVIGRAGSHRQSDPRPCVGHDDARNLRSPYAGGPGERRCGAGKGIGGMISTVAELDRHALTYRLTGYPVFSDESGDSEVVGVVVAQRVPLGEVTGEAAIELGRRYFAMLAERDEKRPNDAWMTDARCYAIVMEQNGVECYHPPHWRSSVYRDARLPRGGFWCEACDNVFIPKTNASSSASPEANEADNDAS